MIIKGQCTLMMKNKVKSMKDYKKTEKNNNVVALLKCLKGLAFTTAEVQYVHWTANQSMRKMLMMHQQDSESLAMFTSDL